MIQAQILSMLRAADGRSGCPRYPCSVPGSTSIEDFLPALERAVRHAVPKPLALVLNYPSNPTAQVVDLDFYAAVVDFCKRQGIWILSDLAYAEIYFDGVGWVRLRTTLRSQYVRFRLRGTDLPDPQVRRK